MAATAHAPAHAHESLHPLPQLPEIPAKRYFAIGEVADLCGVRPHVLRYWEQEFTQLKPVKRRGNRRYYLREDIEIVRAIRRLLHEQGFTITGARQQLAQQLALAQVASRRGPRGVVGRAGAAATAVAAAGGGARRAGVAAATLPVAATTPPEPLNPTERQREIQNLVDDLEGFLDRLDLD